MTPDKLKNFLKDIPETLQSELVTEYNKIIINFRESRWEPTELSGGKFCEVVYTILKGYCDGNYSKNTNKPKNFIDACEQLKSANGSISRSVRIDIPRLLVVLYDVRNHRGVAHVNNEISPNLMDSTLVINLAKWVLAELLRVFHVSNTQETIATIENIIEKEVATLWNVNNKLRVLTPNLSMKDQTLVLLYKNGSSNETDLIDWIEPSNTSVYRRDVLRPLHKLRYLEYDSTHGTLKISPTGITHVEKKILTKDK